MLLFVVCLLLKEQPALGHQGLHTLRQLVGQRIPEIALSLQETRRLRGFHLETLPL